MDTVLNIDLILGRGVLYELGIILNFNNNAISWQKVSIFIEPLSYVGKEIFVMKEIVQR